MRQAHMCGLVWASGPTQGAKKQWKWDDHVNTYEIQEEKDIESTAI